MRGTSDDRQEEAPGGLTSPWRPAPNSPKPCLAEPSRAIPNPATPHLTPPHPAVPCHTGTSHITLGLPRSALGARPFAPGRFCLHLKAPKARAPVPQADLLTPEPQELLDIGRIEQRIVKGDLKP